MNTNFLIQMPPCQSETFPFSRLRRVRIFLLTPCFSWVWQRAEKINRFNGLRPLLFILSLLATSAQAQQAIDPKPVDSSPDSNTRVVAETPYAVAARDGNQKIWSKVTWESNSLTGELTAKTNSFIELATASAHLVNGVWADSTDQIEITKTGAQATNSQHRLEFLGNINTSRAIDITLPEGDKHLRSTPIGLSYFDTASGKSVLIAELRNSSGQLLNSGNQVLYPSCFTDIEADLFYVNQIDKVEQLVILRQQLPAPEEWGLDSASTLLQVISEFFNPPSPVITQHIVRGAVDEQLDFGIMQMVKGEAFAIGSETNTIPVTKQWLLLDGTRQCLVESTPFTRLEPLLKDLPAPPAQAQLQDSPDGILHRVARGHPLPERKFAAKSSRPMIVASAMPKAKGVAIDWTTLTAQTNFTLKGDTTYYVSSAVNLSSTTICEGGCVVKFSPTNSSSLKLLGSVVWANSAYRPTIFSSRDDDTVGDTITGSTGNPATNFYGGIALDLSSGSGSVAFSNARFSYLSNAIAGVDGYSITVSNAQFNQCYTIISPHDKACYFRNCLFYNIGTLQWEDCTGGCDNAAVHMENVTMHNCTNFSSSLSAVGGTVWLTNTLLVNVTNLTGPSATIYTNHSFVLYGDSGIFQTVGASSHILADSSPYRNAGTTSIDPSLLSALRKKTTYPPIVLTNNFTVDTVLSPQAQRNTGTPDIGYEYDPLDYVVNGMTLTNTLTLTNGVALGTYGSSSSYGISISGTGKLISGGSPTSLNYIVRYNTVQEQSTTNWSSSTVGPSIKIAAANASAQCRFTAWSVPAGVGDHFNTALDSTANSFKDCQFTGGKFTFYPGLLNLTNSLFERVFVTTKDNGDNDQFYLFNNLFRGGTLSYQLKGVTPVALAYDNMFDSTTFSASGTNYTCGNNGYVTNKARLTAAASDKILTNSPVYLTSYLGNYYYPTNDGMLSTLTNAGSRTASSATLYHYTCWTNQQNEASSAVEIGFHFVACDANGNPIDSNSDGIPDYLADPNGNGILDFGEIPFGITIDNPANGSVINK